MPLRKSVITKSQEKSQREKMAQMRNETEEEIKFEFET